MDGGRRDGQGWYSRRAVQSANCAALERSGAGQGRWGHGVASEGGLKCRDTSEGTAEVGGVD